MENIFNKLNSEGFNILNTLKEHNFKLGKGNYICENEEKKYLVKVFSGFKRKYLRSEMNMRSKLIEQGFLSQEEGRIFEDDDFVYLALPYLENEGNIEGREEEFSDQVVGLARNFHSLPLEKLGGIKYRLITSIKSLEEDFPHSTLFLENGGRKSKVSSLLKSLSETIIGESYVLTHNDYNGDNILVDKNNNLILTDFEKCGPNFKFEDLSKAYFFSLLNSDLMFESSKLYNKIMEDFYPEKQNFDVFTLYQSLRFFEHIENYPNFRKFSKIQKTYRDNLLNRIVEGVCERV